MPKVRNESNYRHDINDNSLTIEDNKIVKATKTLNSQRRAIQNYEKKVEQLTVRLPQGSREKLNSYIANNSKYQSVNAMIKDLIENEIGESLD